MGRVFVSSVPEYFQNTAIAMPDETSTLTFSSWFQTTDNSTQQGIMIFADTATNNPWMGIFMGSSGKFVAGTRDDAGTEGRVDSTASVVNNTWHHGCGIINGVSSRKGYLDGVTETEDTTTVSTTTIDNFCIGAWERTTLIIPWDGYMAENAIWNVALNEGEVAALAKGYSPLFIRPHNLLYYWPLNEQSGADNAVDRMGVATATQTGTPGPGPHPPMIYPRMPPVFTIPIVTGIDIPRPVPLGPVW